MLFNMKMLSHALFSMDVAVSPTLRGEWRVEMEAP
jgi:hypothetical protein